MKLWLLADNECIHVADIGACGMRETKYGVRHDLRYDFRVTTSGRFTKLLRTLGDQVALAIPEMDVRLRGSLGVPRLVSDYSGVSWIDFAFFCTEYSTSLSDTK